jgi:hypothetical protein
MKRSLSKEKMEKSTGMRKEQAWMAYTFFTAASAAAAAADDDDDDNDVVLFL